MFRSVLMFYPVVSVCTISLIWNKAVNKQKRTGQKVDWEDCVDTVIFFLMFVHGSGFLFLKYSSWNYWSVKMKVFIVAGRALYRQIFVGTNSNTWTDGSTCKVTDVCIALCKNEVLLCFWRLDVEISKNAVMATVNITDGQERLGTLADYLERCMLHMKATAKKSQSICWTLPPCFLSEL